MPRRIIAQRLESFSEKYGFPIETFGNDEKIG